MKVAMLVLVSALFILTAVMAVPGMASAAAVEYYIIIEDNGNSLVIITIDGSGLFQIPIQEDVEDVDVEGALYIIENGVLELSIGGTGAATVIYQTTMLTNKDAGVWQFDAQLMSGEKGITIAMPEHTIIMGTTPQPLIESGEIMKLHWSGDVGEVSVRYYFPTGKELRYAAEPIYVIGIVIASVLVLAALAYFMLVRRKRIRVSMSKRNSVIATLSENEKKIVSTLIESNGRIKRSRLERVTAISKSSLAASLRNLERKKILEVDRTYASHHVKFTEWFDGL